MNMQKLITSFKQFLISALLLALSMAAHAQPEDSEPESINQGQLEQILAPIALYPDTILSHILVAATYPLEVVQAERWTARNPELKGAEAVQAVDDQEWDPSVQALVAFPQILKRMSEDLEWTTQLGDAFLQDEQQLLASVQILRKLAEQAGSLDEMQNVSVIREDKIIIIEPREREIVYVPYYDSRVVYGPWRWQSYDPIFWDYPYYDRYQHGNYYTHNRQSSFYWSPRVSLSFGFFFNSFDWQDRHLVRISSRHYSPRRYYNHSDILGHGYAERWVHNSERRYGRRNRHIVNHDYQNDKPQHNGVKGSQRQQTRTPRQSHQERVRDQLAIPVNRGGFRHTSVNQNPLLNNRSASVRASRVELGQPIKNSGVGASNRGSSNNEPQISTRRNANRELERQRPSRRSQQSNGGFASQQRAVAVPQASRPQVSQANRPAPAATRPSPPPAQSTPVQSRQSNNVSRADKPRSGPKKAPSGSRRESRQVR